MKIGFTGMELPEGKVKYNDLVLVTLKKKDNPAKFSPFFAELLRDEFIQSEAIVVPKKNILDILILDIEKIETRLSRLDDGDEQKLLQRCMEQLEAETPLCDVSFNSEEDKILRAFAPISIKPVAVVKGDEDIDTIISLVLEKAGYMFFYTTGPDESRPWLVKNSDIVVCAERIHTDIARGFIKGDVVSFDDYLTCHSFNECRSKGLVRVVDRGYIVQPKEILEIRFNV